MKLFILFIGVFAALCNGQQRIAGGDPTTVQEYPYASALLKRNDAGVFEKACGGTIISHDALLSSAACFYSGQDLDPVSWWRARVGSTNRNGGGTIHIVSRIVIHPDFDLDTLDSNIAVLRTRFTINMVPGLVERAFLPGTAYNIVPNRAVQAIGWGVDRSGNSLEQLRVTNIFTIDQQICANRYNGVNVNVTDNMMCAGFLDVGVRGQCEGDEGSPLIEQGTVVGVYSHNRGCADYWFPAINTRVPVFSRWIVANAIS